MRLEGWRRFWRRLLRVQRGEHAYGFEVDMRYIVQHVHEKQNQTQIYSFILVTNTIIAYFQSKISTRNVNSQDHFVPLEHLGLLAVPFPHSVSH